MENLLNHDIQCTDPDTLQFCLPYSDTEFWYCQVNDTNVKLLPDAQSTEKLIYDILCGYPKGLLNLSKTVTEVNEFISNRQFWFTSDIDVTEFDHEEQLELLKSYGYSWNDFNSDVDRNQIICECYFEENICDFDNY